MKRPIASRHCGYAWRALALVPIVWSVVVALPDRADASPRPIRIGFADPLLGAEPPLGDTLRRQGRRAGGSIARLNVSWASVAPPKRRRDFHPRNPMDSSYLWDGVDAAVRRTAEHGYRILLTVYDAPRWAEGSGRPASAPPGTWKPRAAMLGDFAAAIAARYRGTTPDPAQPQTDLPRVRLFQAWNEQNLSSYLTPQWVGRRAVSPAHYASMLNAFYAGVHSAQEGARVLTGGTAPYGDRPGGERVPPVTFIRGLLCLGARLRPLPCPKPARFDVLAHHPINAGSPLQSAASPLDATTPDFGPLRHALRKAVRTGRALPRSPKPLWATEMWWDSSPPDPRGVPLRRQARWYELSLYVLWRQGVRAAIFLQIRDAPPIPSYAASTQSGIYFLSGRAKPAARALQFPFVVRPRHGGGLIAWCIPPRRGAVSIERRIGRKWSTVARVGGSAGKPVVVQLPKLVSGSLRAAVGKETSLVYGAR